ncbi:microcephalin-like [Elysia marginata]|uniref:Microcephalin-like n=1 Tax=Elysia marginata TaxID=1093978 RepID=A0AAV4HB08_9GAST|nr:microcephalin-like [Elysia marginata]
MRSMQPCDFEEEVARSAERGEKRRRRVMMANRFKLSEESTPNTSPVPILAMETQPRSLMLGTFSQTGSPVPDTPPSMKERLERMRREQMNERLASDFASAGTSSDEEPEGACDVVKQLICRLESDDGGNTSSGSTQNSVGNLKKGLIFKPLTPGGIAKLQNELASPSSKANSPTVKGNRRRSLRISSGASPLIPRQSSFPASGEHHKRNVYCENSESQKNDKSESNSHSSNNLSLPLSQKDINICAPSDVALQADKSTKKLSDDGLVADVEDTCVNHCSKEPASNKDCEKSSPKPKQRRRSSRISLKEKGISPDIKSGNSDEPYQQMNAGKTEISSSKLVKKRRNLYTEPDLNTSLPKPSESKSKNTLINSENKISDVAFFFGTSENNNQASAINHSRTIKRKSVSSINNSHAPILDRKSACNLNTNESASNDTLGTSMSIMYGNDTTLSCEDRSSNSRRSIEEFRCSKKRFKRTKNAKVVEKSKLDQIEESEQTAIPTNSKNDQAHTVAPEKPTKLNAKRDRDPGWSNDSVEAVPSKKQKSSSEGENQFSSPHQPNHVQPRLRHARSLVLEPPQSPSVKGVQYSIVVTSLHRHEQELVYSVLKKLGVFHLTNTVEWSSTHIVCGEPRRTLNLLKAIARGCWVLSKEWVFNSLEAGTWLEEENFEICKELPVVKRSRLARHRAGDAYRVDLFSNIGPIFITGGCKPPRKELIHLVQLCSGKVTGTQSKASLCIGETGEPNKTIIKPTWILDSIMKLECLPVEEYIVPAQRALFSQRESSPEF